MIRRFLDNYLPRHRNRTNQVLHVIGIPLSFIVAPVAAIAGAAWYWHAGCFITGYLLQFSGHTVEGNDAGEVVFLKKMLGLPYNEYASDTSSSSNAELSDDTTSACS
jgi:hypothetical protein